MKSNWKFNTKEAIQENSLKEDLKAIARDIVKQNPNSNDLWVALAEEENKTLTEKGALTFKSSQSKVLDLFAMGGSLRKRKDEEIQSMISNALQENFNLGVKCLFYLRDIRGG